jgi:hypothetical protein
VRKSFSHQLVLIALRWTTVHPSSLVESVESEGYQPHDSLVAALLRESAYRHLW